MLTTLEKLTIRTEELVFCPTNMIRRLTREHTKLVQSGYEVSLPRGTWETLSITFVPGGETLYSGYRIRTTVSVTSEYPLKAPSLKVEGGILHPNIDPESGKVCLNVISTDWNPGQSLVAVMASLEYLLANPNTESPLNGKLAALYESDPEAYRTKVVEHCRTHLESA